MSKQGKRKITVDLPKVKDLATRPSVFERLGTKKSSSVKKTTEFCRQWVQNGSCIYGKNCKFASTHTLISPSKQRAANKGSEVKRCQKEDAKNRLHSRVIVRSGRSPDGEIDNWDQNDLECADTDVLEKRRQQLQRELELQLKMDSSKDIRKDIKKKQISSSSSSRSSSTSSVSSSSASTSSSSTGREPRRKGKKGKLKRNSSSSSDGEGPSKKKISKSGSLKRDKSEIKKANIKKDDKNSKKHDTGKKKEMGSKAGTIKKSLSPGKKSGGTPPITSKSVAKNITKNLKSPQKKERNRSISPSKDKEKGRAKEKEREKDKEKEHDKERERTRGRTRSPRKGRSRSPRRHGSNPKDLRKKDSPERRPVSPKKQPKKDTSTDRHRKRSLSRDRDRGRDYKDRSLERRKNKHDEKDRHERKDRRDRAKEPKRGDDKRRGRDRGLGRNGPDKGLEKPNKPMERLLPRPEERLAALAAISNKVLGGDKTSSTSKDRQDSHSERGGRKQERSERGRSNKRERMGSLDRDQGDYEMSMDRQYDHSLDRYDRADDRYDDPGRNSDRSPGYNRERHYDNTYEISGPPRGYPDDDDRMYGDHMSDHRGVDIGYDDRRTHRDRSWERRSGSIDRDRGYIHTHKEWDNDDYRAGGDWGRDRPWPVHDAPMTEWGDKEQEVDNWHGRGPPPGLHRSHEYGRGMRMDHGRGDNKRRIQRNETETVNKESPAQQTQPAPLPQPRQQEADADDKPVPDDLSEISDDPDDILNRDDMGDQNIEEDSPTAPSAEDGVSKLESSEKESTQDTTVAAEEKEPQDMKDDEDVTNLDFEEISDGELEEERTRAGLGDALGVDWASLVADVNRREKKAPLGDARSRWQPERVLARLGLSIDMAGKDLVQDILNKNSESIKTQKKELEKDKSEDADVEQNGNQEAEEVTPTDVSSLHPVAAIQVAMEKRKRQRAVLFGAGSEITRALSARRDLALRRYLCQLPTTERSGQTRVTPQPSLFHAARALLMQAPVSG